MATLLFHDIVFGPVRSRRLGVSLGVNLLPLRGKRCTFDCIYCECGYNKDGTADRTLPGRDAVRQALEERLLGMQKQGEQPDVITFAGNGEPTLHPDFEGIVDDTIALRDLLCPDAKICVLSNATQVRRPEVFRALRRVDRNILKLDSARTETLRLLNAPGASSYTAEQAVENLSRFEGNLIVQTLFVRGEHAGQTVDNTTPEEIDAWLEALRRIAPRQAMLYTIDRETPEKNLRKVSREELEAIADRVKALGIETTVSA